jgi:hypothetical protein
VIYFLGGWNKRIDDCDAVKLVGFFPRLYRIAAYEGIGIGLSTGKRTIESYGGRVWATFYFAPAKKSFMLDAWQASRFWLPAQAGLQPESRVALRPHCL